MPIVAPFPIEIPSIIVEFGPIKTLSSIVTLPQMVVCAVIKQFLPILTLCGSLLLLLLLLRQYFK